MPATTGMSNTTKAVWGLAAFTVVVSIFFYFRTSDALTRASKAVYTAENANSRADVAKNMAKAIALEGDLPEPEDPDELKNMDPQERIIRNMMKTRKTAKAKELQEIEELKSVAKSHRALIDTLDENVRGNQKAITETSNSVMVALGKTSAQINSQDEKIRLILSTSPTRKEVDDLHKITKELNSERQNADLTVSSLSESVTSLSNRLASARIRGEKAPKKVRTKGTNVVAVTKGEINTDNEDIVSGTITRVGHPVVKEHWYNRSKLVDVTYEIHLIGPDKADTGMDEALFQQFEAANGKLMAKLAKVKEKDDKSLTELSVELAEEFKHFLNKITQRKLPDGVKFVGATAKATVVPTKTSTAKNP